MRATLPCGISPTDDANWIIESSLRSVPAIYDDDDIYMVMNEVI